MVSARYAATTARARRGYLLHFTGWLRDAGIATLDRLDAPILESYRAVICDLRTHRGSRIGTGAITQRLLALRGFLRWCAKDGALPLAWGGALALPRPGHSLPVRVLTAAEVERLLALPNLTTALGLRDRAMLEVFYAAGLRRAEVARLASADVDHSRRTVWVRRGKGGRDRVVPLGERAVAWIERYLRGARPSLVRGSDPPWLFLTCRGNPWQPKHLGERVGRYLRRAGLGRRGSCHVLRHTMATLMLEHGADVRSLQAMLGHACLSTTEIYAHVAIGHLCAVHARSHPVNRAGACRSDIHVYADPSWPTVEEPPPAVTG